MDPRELYCASGKSMYEIPKETKNHECAADNNNIIHTCTSVYTNSNSFGLPYQSQHENLQAPLCLGRYIQRNMSAANHGNGGHTA